MKKLISISAVLLLLMGAVWVISSCNKDTDTPTTTVTSTEETIISTTEGGVIDRGCSPCPGYRALAGEATNYNICIYNRVCPTNPWSLVGCWNHTQWPVFPSYQPYPFNIDHDKEYKVVITNNSVALAYFSDIRIFNTSMLTNLHSGPISIPSGGTYTYVYSPRASCGCGWIYGCSPNGH